MWSHSLKEEYRYLGKYMGKLNRFKSVEWEMKDSRVITEQIDKSVTQGICLVHGTQMYRIGESPFWHLRY